MRYQYITLAVTIGVFLLSQQVSSLALEVDVETQELNECAVDLGSQNSAEMVQELAQKSSSRSSSYRSGSSGSKSGSNDWGGASFIIGCILIPFSLVLLWKNEKKVVTFSKCMDQGRDKVRTVDCEDPDEQNEFELVHSTGISVNKDEVVDNDFGIVARDSYRLKRKVEMYQYRENVHGDGDNKTYTYEGVWSDVKIDSNTFHSNNYKNPNNAWPFKSRSFEASNVTLGKYRLRPDQILRLGRGQTKKVSLEEEGGLAIKHSSQNMDSNGFAPFEVRGIYLVSSTHNNAETAPHVGQYRVTFEYDTCGPVTIIAQQVQNEDGHHTFRKWNPEKINVPYGQMTDADSNVTTGSPLFCYICLCVDAMCDTMFEEVVDCAVDTKLTSMAYFDDQGKNIASAARCVRPAGIVLSISGWFLLFIPVIQLLSWIPLVGWLLGSVVAVAAAAFSIVVGLILAIVVIAMAWLIYRPLIGALLFTMVGVGIYFIFFFNQDAAFAVVDETESTKTATQSATALAQILSSSLLQLKL